MGERGSLALRHPAHTLLVGSNGTIYVWNVGGFKHFNSETRGVGDTSSCACASGSLFVSSSNYFDSNLKVGNCVVWNVNNKHALCSVLWGRRKVQRLLDTCCVRSERCARAEVSSVYISKVFCWRGTGSAVQPSPFI
jgi:hypothetical protein